MTIFFRHLYFFITISLFTFLLSGCHDEALLNSLNQRQANEVLAVLQKHQIMVSKSSQGKGTIKLMLRKRTCRLRYSYYKNINYLYQNGLRSLNYFLLMP